MKKLLSVWLLLLCSLAALAQVKPLIVAQDGSGTYRTVQAALDAVPKNNTVPLTILIKKGTYKEKLSLAKKQNFVKLLGEDLEQTILVYDDYNGRKTESGEPLGTSEAASFRVFGNNFTAENLTFQNSAGLAGQAPAMWVYGDKARFLNCRFLGNQDTLYTYGYGSRQYYQNCYIEGTVDFIFGSSTAFFEDCTIFCKQPGGYVTAASTPDSTRYGYVFLRCKITGDAPAGSFMLGRPWRPYAKTVFIGCDLGEQIGAAGWDHWGKETNKQTATYAEYRSKGKGAQPRQRVAWSHQLTDEQAKEYTREKVFRNWDPTKE
jgi:pectinesterase